ncbi:MULTISPECIES: adenylyltransferase/cytidyltransferase family protein [unclassified Microcoleus]
MRFGVTVGKFYPFHKGHDYLIREAKKRLTV